VGEGLLSAPGFVVGKGVVSAGFDFVGNDVVGSDVGDRVDPGSAAAVGSGVGWGVDGRV